MITVGSKWHRKGKSSRYIAWVVKVENDRVYLHAGSGVWRMVVDRFLEIWESVT